MSQKRQFVSGLPDTIPYSSSQTRRVGRVIQQLSDLDTEDFRRFIVENGPNRRRYKVSGTAASKALDNRIMGESDD